MEQQQQQFKKVAYNAGYRDFSISYECYQEMERMGYKFSKAFHPVFGCSEDIPHDDLALVKAIEKLGIRASNGASRLVLKKVPIELDGYYVIRDDEGNEEIEYDLTKWLKENIDKLNASNVESWKNRAKLLLKLSESK